ncbi:MAG: hypothetical protein C4575_07420 [Desulforudis sp.]|nr:MAG: hypothetical protein C4575_07420 [Desulforudis sp.]
MEARYWLYAEEFQKHREAVAGREPIRVEIMDQKEKVWKQARIVVFEQAAEGSEPAGLLGPFGEPFAQGKYYVKVLEELLSPLEDEE